MISIEIKLRECERLWNHFRNTHKNGLVVPLRTILLVQRAVVGYYRDGLSCESEGAVIDDDYVPGMLFDDHSDDGFDLAVDEPMF
ncbi:hypothetical protein KIN20_016171 [Parelaphostrongylus tenuis]|uniref:Uncharacterized protein n=1 Tax=Parelaphostrongylus tenuis TaxID=148309 RepID=A0AAD5MY82_PARTN|nr:hypothetical protein KIN20_016171 [Parelaphostrongylus tenuis]